MKHYLFTIALASLLGSAHATDRLQAFKDLMTEDMCATGEPSCHGPINAIKDVPQLEQYLEKSCVQESRTMGCIAKAVWVLGLKTSPLSSGEFSEIAGILCHLNSQQMNLEELVGIQTMLRFLITDLDEEAAANPTREMDSAMEKCQSQGIVF